MKRLVALHLVYVDDIAELREPYRDAHLARIREWQADGRLVIAGALGDPPRTGLLAFDASREEVEEFARTDPYTEAGLVVSHRIEPWNVVA